ncbi:hypothetical protein OAB94_02085, partial [Flavobacteriaceae bacterium]|nr:hypothetical protein [Flavobacteriaceae bacterium]
MPKLEPIRCGMKRREDDDSSESSDDVGFRMPELEPVNFNSDNIRFSKPELVPISCGMKRRDKDDSSESSDDVGSRMPELVRVADGILTEGDQYGDESIDFDGDDSFVDDYPDF